MSETPIEELRRNNNIHPEEKLTAEKWYAMGFERGYTKGKKECAERCIELIIANGLSEQCVKEIKMQFLHNDRESRA